MTVNIGHPDIIPIAELAEMIRARLGASKSLIKTVPFPGMMTAVKRPTLDRMTKMLGVTPKVSIQEGVDRLCKRIQERIRDGGRAAL
jgi:nucleoside-diphosphate-sugar epimerase